MKKIRYPFTKYTLSEWVEVPFDATDREAGTFEVQLQSLPQEKINTLRYQLVLATKNYLNLQRLQEEAKREARGEGVQPTDEDLLSALAFVKKSEIALPLKRLMVDAALYSQQNKRETDGESAEGFLSRLRLLASSGSSFGYEVLGVAESLFLSQAVAATQIVEEHFEPQLAEALGSISRARANLIALGVVGHRGLIGELIGPDGEPIPDDEGKPKEAPLPFVSQNWTWGLKPKRGCSEGTIELYRSISPNNGLLVSLSEAVLLYQKGYAPSPEDIWRELAPKKATPKKEEVAKLLNGANHPNDQDPTNSDDDEAPAPLA